MNSDRLMHTMRAGKRFLIDRQYRRMIIAATGFYDYLSDEKYLRKIYYANTGRKLNLENPKTFNEKLQWLKLYNRQDKYIILSDKYLVKDYVAKLIGCEHIVPTLGVWDDPDQIDFEQLPNQFVLKCNHNSGLGMCICKDKESLNISQARANLARGLAQNYYQHDREWTYKKIPRKIVAEKYMKDSNVIDILPGVKADGLIDYKFYCFNGEPRFLYVGFANIVDGNKHDLMTYLTLDWKLTPFIRPDHEQLPTIPERPKCFDELVEYARVLADDIPFVRVDFFIIENQIYFSEFTFSPGGGYGIFYPEEWERKLGDWIKLPEKIINE